MTENIAPNVGTIDAGAQVIEQVTLSFHEYLNNTILAGGEIDWLGFRNEARSAAASIIALNEAFEEGEGERV